jgi:hypothetical protein
LLADICRPTPKSAAKIRGFEKSRLEDAARTYTDEQALEFAVNSWVTGTYFDIHCSVFTPDSFVRVFSKLKTVGILNIEISRLVSGPDEFFVRLIKLGKPKIAHPGRSLAQANLQDNLDAVQARLDAVLASSSWRLTAPLRSAVRLLRCR